MRIGYGVTVLARGTHSGGIDGIGMYTRELGAALQRLDDIKLNPVTFGHRLDAGDLPAAKNFGRFAPRALASSLFPIPFAGSSSLRGRIDVFHATDHYVPRLSGIPVVATLMDAIPLSHPEWVTMHGRSVKNWLWRRTARRAQRVITISQHSKREIVEYFGIDENRVRIVPLGVDARHFNQVNPAARDATLAKFGLRAPFFLFVGTLQPRKNLSRMIAAHDALPADMRRAAPLVIVGREGWGCDALIPKLRKADSGPLRWLRYVSDNETSAIMQSATALVFPSLYEGFGLPVLEAFAAGLPVITSRTTALPEVAGDAALTVDPLDVDQIAAAMRTILEDSTLRQTYRERGLQRARAFTWDRTAIMTAQVYREAALLA